ncbi:IclR family transcriptional regulator [Pectobacterium cacticida]|uniref:IclR family transcriptional regulator n=1 Tax=Pectobacterium cacticida TaxID=69221 RepID=A0ABZ2GA86_9GAMM|nr:IclR family transcriptional regulator [Pectobacterium cacticida]UYX07516.1 IclR family transcriptional regulator [Pectobacterium cacticida]
MLESTKVPALTRAIEIMNLIARRGPLSAAEIIADLAIPKSTTYLLLAELKRHRFVSVDANDNYCLWTKLVELAEQALSKIDLRDISRARLTQLMEQTNLLCHLGIIDGENAYYILKVESPSTISVRSHEGKSLSLSRSGIGKCLLAWQPDEPREKIIANLDFSIKTPNTIKTPEQLRAELTKIRRQGWSYDNGEDYVDVRCVAAPVFNSRNELTAAISVVGTRLQINNDNRDLLASQTIACARDISRLLGWRSPFDRQTA